MTSRDSDEQDRQDMARLMAGSEAGLNDLMERHGTKLFHYLLRALQDEEEAADLAQETFVRVYQNRAKYRLEAPFSAWLYTIASNLARDRFRWRRRHAQVSLEASDEITGKGLRDSLPEHRPGPSEELEAQERAEAVRQAVAALPEELRLPLILAEYEGRSQAEIAAILNCTVKAVETRIYRARIQLRARLAGMVKAA